MSDALLGLADAELREVSWIEGGRDIVLLLSSRPECEHKVTCTWAHGLEIRMLVPEGRGGAPLLWEVTQVGQPDNTLMLTFDFGKDGLLRVRCNEVRMETKRTAQT